MNRELYHQSVNIMAKAVHRYIDSAEFAGVDVKNTSVADMLAAAMSDYLDNMARHTNKKEVNNIVAITPSIGAVTPHSLLLRISGGVLQSVEANHREDFAGFRVVVQDYDNDSVGIFPIDTNEDQDLGDLIRQAEAELL